MKRLLESHLVLLALVFVVAALYLGARFDQGWIPHDEGLLSMTAERVLAGELPHRDFNDTYTGGLAFLHAFAFRLFGVHLLAPRVVLLAFSLLFVVAFYRLATRFAEAPLAALLTLVAFFWSLPNYFAGLPSWYNLFFSVFGALALVKYLEDENRSWLFAAGLCGGLSFLFKLSGLFYVAAALLVLVYREQATAGEGEPKRGRMYSFFTVACLTVFVAGLAVVVTRKMAASALFYFVFPAFVLALVVAIAELRRETSGRWRQLFVPGAVFLAGVAVPVGIFLWPYAVTGGLGDFWSGVFVAPGKRLDFAMIAPPALSSLVAVVPVAALFFLRSRRFENVLLLPAVLLLGAGAVFGSHPWVYTAIWSSLRPLVPLAAVVGGVLLVRATGLSALHRQQLFLVLAMGVMFSLVQFPYAHGIYFCYASPWVVLMLAFLVRSQPRVPRRLFLCVLIFYCAFTVIWLNRGVERHFSDYYAYLEQETDMGIDRGGLRISLPMAYFYQQVTGIVREHSQEGSYIYATPDCPEVYFLSGRKNPTRSIYDFLDDDFADPAERTRRILARLEEHDVDLVVLNWWPAFSPRIQGELAEALKARYPQSWQLSPFSVHWREPDAP